MFKIFFIICPNTGHIVLIAVIISNMLKKLIYKRLGFVSILYPNKVIFLKNFIYFVTPFFVKLKIYLTSEANFAFVYLLLWGSFYIDTRNLTNHRHNVTTIYNKWIVIIKILDSVLKYCLTILSNFL